MYSKSNEVHIWYLFNSGFAVKTSRHLLVFDYYLDSADGAKACLETGVLNPKDVYGLDVVVFSSHRHSDHFNPVIFNWRNEIQNIKYVLSYDIKLKENLEGVLSVHPGCQYDFEGVHITALDSTDIGAAFLVNCDGVTIFHAGDLNWWHWKGEPEDENLVMAENYKKQIDLLRDKHIDFAFIPLDPRLEEYYLLGLDYFMKNTDAEVVFPMHFGNEYSVFKWLKKDIRAAQYLKRTVDINRRGQYFVFDMESFKK